jgi:RNA polymerase sigma-70 factor (ECF subfamily)
MVTTPTSLLPKLANSTEPAARVRFVELRTPLLPCWARRPGLDEHDAAGLLQDLFALLVVKLPLYQSDPGHSFRSWLHTVLPNRWRNHVRAARAAPVGTEPVALDSLADFHPPSDLEERECRSHLAHRALQLIRTDFQEATWKAFWVLVVCDRPADGVAAELGLSANAVHLARSRALRRLREEFGEFLD